MTSFTHMKKQNTGDIIKKEKDHKGEKRTKRFWVKVQTLHFQRLHRMGLRVVCLGKGLFEPTINLSAMAEKKQVDNVTWTYFTVVFNS